MAITYMHMYFLVTCHKTLAHVSAVNKNNGKCVTNGHRAVICATYNVQSLPKEYLVGIVQKNRQLCNSPPLNAE